MKIILSRTDGIGDVVLTLPLAGIIKKQIPNCEIVFLATKYTKPIIDTSIYIDKFIDWSVLNEQNKDFSIKILKEENADAIIHLFPNKKIAEISKKANIPLRIGTTGRFYHWIYLNKLIPISRKRSNLHEAQLNIALLKGLNLENKILLNQIPAFYGMNKIKQNDFSQYLSKEKINIILHPKTKGSAREWGIENFSELIKLLPKEKYNILVSGTKEEGKTIENSIFKHFPNVQNITGKFNLTELIDLISQSDALVAASTGPLHIAAALGKVTIGIYAPMKPIHPGRWAPIGENAAFLVSPKNCNKCKKSVNCECIQSIKAMLVYDKLENLFKKP